MEEEGIVPSSGQVPEEKHSSRTTFSLTKLKAMSALGYARRSDGLSSQQHWQPATVSCSRVPRAVIMVSHITVLVA